MLRSIIHFSTLAAVMASGAFAQATVGTAFCTVVPNSTGAMTTLTGSFGSGVGSDLHLEVTNGVPGEFGYFLVGDQATPGVTPSLGRFCLAGVGAHFYRYNLAGTASTSIGRFDSAGVIQNLTGTSATGAGFDVPSAVPATMPIHIMGGDTWHFQLWHRDTPSGTGRLDYGSEHRCQGGAGRESPCPALMELSKENGRIPGRGAIPRTPW